MSRARGTAEPGAARQLALPPRQRRGAAGLGLAARVPQGHSAAADQLRDLRAVVVIVLVKNNSSIDKNNSSIDKNNRGNNITITIDRFKIRFIL